ncbi:uncharacterized protein LOC124788974 [Schistocerca piceifrons]|uniref:uncharacterized protein LOC124788974 n=1 Tax=Schistocerca piceifrons TaxID=274613 RepID=UPI001F5F3336|nr:uncharacterized protein LOC124788974 [Schistocerca piceifrons]
MKRESHVITRYSWDGRNESVIDYILVNRECREKVTNVKVITSVSADGDHRLLVGQWKMNQCVKNRKQKKVMRTWDWKLKESECAEKYRELITQKFPKDTSWWDDATIQAVRRKNGAWRKWWKTKNDENHKRYIEDKKKCKDSGNSKEKGMGRVNKKKLEVDVKRNEKMFYKMMKNKRKASEVPKLLNAEEQVLEETTNNGEIERSWEAELGQITREEREKLERR